MATTKQIKGGLNRGVGGTIPVKGVLPWLGANFFDGAYGVYDMLNNNVLSPINEAITGNPQPVYNYQGEYQNRLKEYDLPLYGDGGAAQMLTSAPPVAPSARATGAVPPITAASPVRRQTGGAVDTLRSVNPLIPVGGVYSNTGNPGSWSSLAASGQPRAPVVSSQPQGPSSKSYQQQQQPIRNAFTMGAPADDSNARLKAQEAIKRFNIAEESYKSNKTPEAEAAYREAQADTERWSKWAAMPSNTRKQVLMAGERAANAAQGRDNFATLRNEMDTPGAAELLAYAASVNSGGPAVTRQTDGTATVQGRYGSGAITGFVPRGTRTAQSTINDNLLLDQAAQAKIAPGMAADILKNRRY